jgi:4-aminobutyrate aminotransferase/(S)-3-amino-2-methylpropionate transaminase
MPAPGYRTLLSLNGSDAVETALKFAAAASGRPGVIAFEGAYHGLGLGSLEVTHASRFREPFATVLTNRATFLPFPSRETADEILARIRRLASERTIGAVIVEPIQGRGGIRPFPEGFLAALAESAREAGWFLIADEVYTGLGRTGRFLASEAAGVLPDAICLGKALGGGVPISACLMTPGLAGAVSRASGEAVHTSTFLGSPLGCAAACAVLTEIERLGLLARAVRIGGRIFSRAASWMERFPFVAETRGAGAMIGVELRHPGGAPATDEARDVVGHCLREGVLLLTEGPAANVLALTPPLVIPDRDLAFALDVVETALEQACRNPS